MLAQPQASHENDETTIVGRGSGRSLWRDRALATRARAGCRRPLDKAHSLDRRAAAGSRPRHLDHVQRRRRRCAEGRMCWRDGGVLRGRRSSDRLFADVRLVAADDRLWIAEARSSEAAVLGRQGLDLRPRRRSRADCTVVKLLDGSSLRSAAGPQPPFVGRALADAARHEGGAPIALCRHHHVGGPAPRRNRADHEEPADRLRSGDLQHPGPRGRAAHPAAGTGARHRRHRQPALSGGTPHPENAAPRAAGLGRQDRCFLLGAAHPQIHHQPPGRHLRHSGNQPGRSRARKHGCSNRAVARPGAAATPARPCRATLMSEWLSYSLEDFLMFSPRVYWRLFELHNRAVWPAQVLALLLGIAAMAFLLRPRPWSDWLIAVGLGLAWAWVAWSFLWLRYATINWAVAYVAPVFALEALVLILVKGTADRLLFTIDRSLPAGIGMALYLYALVLHPLVPLIEGRSLRSAEVFAIA